MRLYISGPMTGLPDYNYPAFEAAKKALEANGYETLSPHRVEVDYDLSWLEQKLMHVWTAADINKPEDSNSLWAWYMRRAVAQLLCCEGVALLPGWQNSRGVAVELEIAGKLSIPIGPLEEWITGTVTIQTTEPSQPVQVPTRAP